MPRPPLQRRVRGKPSSTFFKPAGIPLRNLEESVLELAEFEAIRLIDVQGLSQQQAGDRMHISQSTLSRTLDSARKKLADAVINGKAIRIAQKGVQEKEGPVYVCPNCHYEEAILSGEQLRCPECGMMLIKK